MQENKFMYYVEEKNIPVPYLNEEGFFVDGLVEKGDFAFYLEPDGSSYIYPAEQVGSRGNKSQREDRLLGLLIFRK